MSKYEIQWWDDWYNAGYLERRQLIRGLLLFTSFKDLLDKDKTLSPEIRLALERSIISLINSHSEDELDYLRERLSKGFSI